MADLTGDRRTLICEAVLELVANGGNRAATHTAVDRRLDLPKGSTSYYYRTRRALIEAAIARLIERSRAYFTVALDGDRSPARVIGDYLDTLISERQRDLRARLALVYEVAEGSELQAALARSLFSTTGAYALFADRGVADPRQSADDLIALCEGMALRAILGGSAPAAGENHAMIARRFPELA